MTLRPPSSVAPRLALSGSPGAALARRSLFALLAIALVAAAAQVAVPIPGTPVPVSLQDLAVLLVGVLLGPRTGAAAMVLYLTAGASGAPVFSNGHAGAVWLAGPTGGYLLSYPAACWAMGVAARRPLSWGRVVVGCLAAQAIVFTGGVTQLALLGPDGWSGAVGLGLVPFLPGILLKTVLLLGFVAVWSAWSGASRRGQSERASDRD